MSVLRIEWLLTRSLLLLMWPIFFSCEWLIDLLVLVSEVIVTFSLQLVSYYWSMTCVYLLTVSRSSLYFSLDTIFDLLICSGTDYDIVFGLL